VIHSLMLLATGIAMVWWRPCRSRGGKAPRLAVALLLTSLSAIWLGSLGVLVGLLSRQFLVFTPAACGVVWRQLVAGQVSPWQLALVAVWLAAIPGRATWALVADLRRNRRLLQGLVAAGRILDHPDNTRHGHILAVPGLSTPALTLGLLRPIVVVDEGFWTHATPVQRDIVLAHERGHICGRHALIDAAGRFLAAGIAPLPKVSQADACLRRHLEALADDFAARRHDRKTVGIALGRIALAAYPAVGLGVAGASLWRVERLVTNSPLRRRDHVLLWAMLSSVAIGLAMSVAEAAHALGPVIDPAYCPFW